MGLFKTVKNFGKDGCYDLEYYIDIACIERVFVRRNDKDVEFWLSPEDIYLLKQFRYRCSSNYYIARSSLISGKRGTTFIHNDILGNYIDHINHIEFDNTRTNLRCCSQRDNSFNRLSSNVHFSTFDGYTYFSLLVTEHGRKGLASVDIFKKYGYSLDSIRFHTEKDALMAVASNIDIVLSNYLSNKEFIYSIFQDFSFNPEALFGFYRGEYVYETAIKKLMLTTKIKDNIWYWYRFDLFDYYKSIGIEAPVKGVDWFENDLGFIVDKEGFSLNPCTRNSKYFYKYN